MFRRVRLHFRCEDRRSAVLFLCWLDLVAASRDRQSNRRVGVETRCAEMSLTDDFAKVQLQAAKATKDLQEPRLGARPRRDLSFGFWAHARPLLTSRPRGSSDF